MKKSLSPFGYKIADGKIVADSEQSPKLYAGYSMPTPQGKHFNRLPMRCLPQGIPYRSDASRWNKKHGEPYPCQCRLLRYGGIPTNHHRRAV